MSYSYTYGVKCHRPRFTVIFAYTFESFSRLLSKWTGGGRFMNGIKVNRKIKRVLIFFGCIMMISLLAICAVYAFWYREQVKITEFDVSFIQYELDYFPYDGGMYRPIEDGKEARQVVAMVLKNKFDDFKSFGYRSEIYYDTTHDIWWVRYYQHHYKVGEHTGGVYDVAMKSDGTLIAYWGEK